MKEFLKIALLCHPTVGGSGILATELGHRLAELGHEVFLISERPPFRFRDEHPRVHFRESTPVEFPLFKSPDHTLPLATKIAQVCREESIDLVHAHYAIPHTAAAWIAKELIGEAAPPIVTTLHGTDIVYLGEMSEYRTLLQHVLEASDKVTCVSDSLKSRALALFSLKEEMEVVPNFYDTKPLTRSREEIRKEIGVGDEPLAIHVSNLRGIKRVDLLLEGFKVATERSDVKLLILAGADASRIQGDIDRLQLSERVVILEDVYEVDNYYAAADFSVFSSEYESFCLGILEGMSHGLPSVSFAVGGIPEVVNEGETGFLAPFGDTAALGEAMARLAKDPPLRILMGEKSKERAEQTFSGDAIVNGYLDVYRSVLSAADESSGISEFHKTNLKK